MKFPGSSTMCNATTSLAQLFNSTNFFMAVFSKIEFDFETATKSFLKKV